MRFVYDADTMGVRIEAGDGEELTDEQAQAIAALRLASAVDWVGDKLGELATELANLKG